MKNKFLSKYPNLYPIYEIGAKVKLKTNIIGPWNDSYYTNDIGIIVSTSIKYLLRMNRNHGFIYVKEDQLEIVELSNEQ